MKSFAQLPFQFDELKLVEEFNNIHQQWIGHFNTGYYTGDWSGITLRKPIGEAHGLSAGNVSVKTYEDTPLMKELPYTQRVLDAIQTEKQAVRYLQLAPNSEIKPHKDFDLVYWDGYVRFHIPIITNDSVKFMIGDEQLNMKPGECWFADFSRTHSVSNFGKTSRIHLVIDCLVNNWVEQLFKEEGIVEANETPPDPIDVLSNEDKKEIINNLRAMGTDTGDRLANEMSAKYQLQ